MKRKSAKKSNMPITDEMRPIIPQASHAGIKVLRYFRDPIIRNRMADPISEIIMAKKTMTIIPEIRSLRRRFLRRTSVSCKRSLRTDFISLSNESIISLKSDN